MRIHLLMPLFSTVVILIIGCKTIVVPNSAEVIYTGTNNGVFYVQSIGYGKKDADALQNAKQNAFQTLLFQGVPGSPQNIPMVSYTEKESAPGKKYYENFLATEKYNFFLTDVNPQFDNKAKGYRSVIVNMGINVNSLRKDLENEGVIRKFGY